MLMDTDEITMGWTPEVYGIHKGCGGFVTTTVVEAQVRATAKRVFLGGVCVKCQHRWEARQGTRGYESPDEGRRTYTYYDEVGVGEIACGEDLTAEESMSVQSEERRRTALLKKKEDEETRIADESKSAIRKFVSALLAGRLEHAAEVLPMGTKRWVARAGPLTVEFTGKRRSPEFFVWGKDQYGHRAIMFRLKEWHFSDFFMDEEVVRKIGEL